MRIGVLQVSDRELRKTLNLPAIHKRTGPRNTTPRFEMGVGKERKGRERRRRGRETTVGVGKGNRREIEGNRNRVRTDVDKTCHTFSKQD